MRSRASREEWARRVAGWRRSGLPARDYAERIGVNHHTLSHWGWRLRGESEATAVDDRREAGPRFIEVAAALARPESAASGGDASSVAAELVLADGLRLRVPLPVTAADAKRIAGFVAALEGR